jgi:hypothetical protein
MMYQMAIGVSVCLKVILGQIVLCACNCGELLLDLDNRRRSRRFLPHHALNLLNQIRQQPAVQPIPFEMRQFV